MKARTQHDTATVVAGCCHHWVLGAPQDGQIKASCRKCGGERVYPAVLDDLDPKAEPDNGQQSGVATAVGGARPSSVAVPSARTRSRLPVGKRT
jgi:hypothetical protein